MSFYDNSPGMVDDLPKAAPPPPGAPAPTPPADPNAELARAGVALFDKSQHAETPVKEAPPAPGPESLAHAPHAEPSLPYGPEVAIELQRAAEASTDPEIAGKAAELAGDWAATFHAHGVQPGEVSALIAAGQAVAAGDLSPEVTEQQWPQEAAERVAAEYGGPENAARLIEQARRYVHAHPRLNDYLQRTRLGNHPRVVLAVVGVAHRANKAGRFK